MQDLESTPQTDVPSPSVSPDFASLGHVMDVPLEVRVELGRVDLPIREILELSSGSIVDMKRVLGEPVEVFINDKLLAKGEIVVLEDVLGIKITQIVRGNGN
jgi:flagellar motor switch protein FliN